MFFAFQMQALSEQGKRYMGNVPPMDEDDSMASFDTIDLEEYLVDETDGMEREGEMAMATLVHSVSPEDKVELNKQKPPDQFGGGIRKSKKEKNLCFVNI